jgi:hypothetical protein
MGYSVRAPTWRYTEFDLPSAQSGIQRSQTRLWNSTTTPATTGLEHTIVFDAFENVNLAFDPAHAAIVKELGALCQIWLQYKSERCPFKID